MRRRFGLMLALAVACAPSAHAALDAVQLRLSRALEMPLRWDNVERAPEWVGGVPPRYRNALRQHTILLHPGEHAIVRVPAHEQLRLTGAGAPLAADEVLVTASQGSGLHAALPLMASDDRRSLLTPALSNTPLLVRVAAARQPLEIGLFVSRREPFDTVAPYREVLPLPAPGVRMQREDAPGYQRFWILEPRMPAIVELQGPARLAFEHRPAYAPGEASLRQTYRVALGLDGAPWHSLEFDAPAESVYPVEVNGAMRAMGRTRMDYVELPPGRHRLTLEPSARLLGRLLRQDDPDYLFARLNAPALPAAQARRARSPWQITDEEIERAVTAREPGPVDQEHIAQRLARDNTRREGGLQAGMLLRESAAQVKEYPEVQRVADEFLGGHSFYRHLLPQDKSEAEAQGFAYFSNRRIHPPGEQARGATAALAHRDDWLARLDQGYFLAAPPIARQEYRLPERSEPTLLRVIADMERAGPGARFYLQLENEAPRAFQLASHDELKAAEYAPDDGSAGLAMLARQHADADAGTLGGPFAAGPRVPARLIRAAAFELPVARHVRRIRVWREGDAPVHLALQYRAAKPFALNESAMLAELRRLDTDALALLRQTLKTADASRPAQELANHWQALARYLRAQHGLLRQNVVPAPLRAEPGERSDSAARQAMEAARAAEREGQWLLALEHWSTAHRRGDGDSRWRAALARVDALLRLGEGHLAEQQLKSLLLSAAPAATRQAALARLEARHEAAADHDALATLRAGLFVESGDAAHLARLVDTLLAQDNHELALAAWLALPEETRPAEQGLRASYRLRWWQTFDALLARLESPAEKALWSGWRALDRGDHAAARAHWRDAGAGGEALLRSLDTGLALLPELRADDAARRGRALARWERWQAEHPGASGWRPEDAALRDYAGAATLYSIERDSYAPAYRLEQGRPLRLTLAGPVRVQLEVRPLHAAGGFQSIDGWVTVRGGGGVRLLPIGNNLPARGLALVDDNGRVPGQRERMEFTLGPGLHELEVEGGTMAALARLYTLRPERSLPVLPPLTADTLGAVLDGRWPSATLSERCLWRDCLSVVEEAGVAWRTPHAEAPTSPPTRFGVGNEGELARILAEIPREDAGADDWPEAAALARGDWEAALSLYPGATPPDAARRMLLLAWRAERQPDARAGALAEAEALAARYPEATEVQALHARIARDAGWLPLPIAHGAGLRTREVLGWQPESTVLRIRKALLPPLRSDEQVVGGGGRLVYDMQSTRASRVRLSLAMADVAGLAPAPLNAVVQLDQQPLRIVALTPQDPSRQVTLAVPPGRHSLRAWIESPLANQFLRIGIDDPRATPALLAAERPYQVATAREPVRFSVAGPAWVRIDEYREDGVRSRYRHVAAGLEHMELAPPAGRDEGLYRVFQRIVADDATRSRPRPAERELEPVAAPLAAFDLRPSPATLALRDGFRLGGQEDGTLSYQAGWHRRSDPDADRGATENFLQLSATHRYYDENRRAYFKSTGLARVRAQGGPTLGVQGQINYLPTWTSLNFELDGSLHAQQPGPAADTEWAASLAGKISQVRRIDPKSYHLPYLRLFARALSMQSDARYEAGRVDQDVFSQYKQQHRQGWEWGDTYYRQPWLDSLWYLGLSATGNPGLNPAALDQASFRAGWRQLLREGQVDLDYRASRFFADDDRSEGYWRHRIELGLSLDHWLSSQKRWELGLRFARDFRTGSNTGMLYLIWHDSEGRRYRDFRPGEIDFRDIRERNAPLSRNNRIEERDER